MTSMITCVVAAVHAHCQDCNPTNLRIDGLVRKLPATDLAP